jgi:hypothetical protein
MRLYESLTARQVDLDPARGTWRQMKRLLLLVVAVAAVAVPTTASAGGATACRNQVFNDWYRDGKIASTYPVACYRDALKHIPADASIYSSLSDDVRAAMRAAVLRAHGKAAPKQVGHGFKAIGAGAVAGTTASMPSAAPPQDNPGGGSGVVGAAEGAPVPILVLGGIALALVAAGAVGAGVRHVRSRRQ